MKQNAMTLAKTGGEKDFEQMIEDLKAKTQVFNNAQTEYNKFIKDKGPRPSSKALCIEAYEGILTAARHDERDQLYRQRQKEY